MTKSKKLVRGALRTAMNQTGETTQPTTYDGPTELSLNVNTTETVGKMVPDSPFLPGTRIQYAWDATCLGYFKRCARLYYYKIILGWRPKEESVHIRFGTEYHKALETYTKMKVDGFSHQEALRLIVQDLLDRTKDWDPDHAYKNRKTLLRTVIYYLDDHQRDATKPYIKPDGRPACELSFKFSLDWGPKYGQTGLEPKPFQQSYLLCGHLDRVVEYMESTFIMDHKTTKGTLGDYYFSSYDLDNQMSLYTLAGQVLFQTPIRGVIIDAAQVLIDTSNFNRGITYRTPDQIDEWVDGLYYWFALQEQCAIANKWPMNDTACDKYGGCEFKSICTKSTKVREQFLKSSFVKEKPWNPLEVR